MRFRFRLGELGNLGNRPTATVFCQWRRFFGCLRHFQKEESRLKCTTKRKALNFKKPTKMSVNRIMREKLSLTHTTFRHQILTDELGIRKICAEMIPKKLSLDQKDISRNRCLNSLESIENVSIFRNLSLLMT